MMILLIVWFSFQSCQVHLPKHVIGIPKLVSHLMRKKHLKKPHKLITKSVLVKRLQFCSSDHKALFEHEVSRLVYFCGINLDGWS